MTQPRHSPALALILALAGGPAFAQEGMIDLGPMLEAMTAPAPVPEPTAPPAEATPPAAPEAAALPVEPAAPVVDADPNAVLPAYVRTEASEAAAGPAAPVSGSRAPLMLPLQTKPYAPILRLSGEVGRGVLTFEVDNPASVSAVQLAVRSSVSLLPAQSRLRFAVNGTEVSTIEPFAFDGFETVTLPVDQVQAGHNRIDITAEGAHRIFCGPDASFEIWTEIDLGQSGVLLAPTAAMIGAQPLRSALAAQIMRHGRVTIQTTEDADPTLLRDLRRRITATVPGAAPELVRRDPYAPVEAGAVDDLAYITLLPAATPFIELRRAANGAQVLVIGGIPDGAMLDDWLPHGAPVSDLPALDPVTADATGGISLAQLGSDDILLESRYSRSVVPFTLPDDWFLIAAQEATVALDYSYAAGLPEGSLMLVKINGTTIRLLPLHGQGNTLLPTLDMGFPVRLLQAGANELSFEAIIPGDPPSLPCSPVSGPMVRIAATTTIDVPPSPAMDVPRVTDVLRALTPEDISLIAGAQAGAIGDRVQSRLVASITPILNRPAGVAHLTVGGLGAMDAAPLNAIGISRQRLEFVLAPQTVATAAPAAEGAVMARAKAIGAGIAQLAWPGDPPIDQWLDGKSGEALVFVDADDESRAWLVVSPTANPQRVAQALSNARFDPQGPKGEAALLQADGTWVVWTSGERMPALKEPVTLANFRAVAGNYASWNPLYFVAIIAGFVIVTVGLALSFITRTRGLRKR